MKIPLTRQETALAEQTTRATFWHERKWHWIVDAIVFTILGLTCVWPILSAGDAVVRLVLVAG